MEKTVTFRKRPTPIEQAARLVQATIGLWGKASQKCDDDDDDE